MTEGEHHSKGVRYSDYFFLLAILFVFLVFFVLLCVGGLVATRWSYKRRTRDKLEEERERHRREEEAWKECERKLREEAERRNERALDREFRKHYEAKNQKSHTTVIKMEPPMTPTQPLPPCNHPAYPVSGNQPLVQTVFVPQPYYPSYPPQLYQTPPQQVMVLPPQQLQNATASVKVSSKRENKAKSSPLKREDVDLDVEPDEASTPSRFTSTSSFTTEPDNDDLPCLSSDFGTPQQAKKKRHLKKQLRGSSSNTTVTETKTITETLASTTGSSYTPSVPVMRRTTRTKVIRPKSPRIPNTWKRRGPSPPPSTLAYTGPSISELYSQPESRRPSSALSTLRRSSQTSLETDTSDDPGTEDTTNRSSPAITEDDLTSKASSPAITDDELTQRTQSPEAGLKSPTSVSVEMPAISVITTAKPITKIPIKTKPKAVADVVQTLARHYQDSYWRLPNERFELSAVDEGFSSPSRSTTSRSSSTLTSKSPPTNLSIDSDILKAPINLPTTTALQGSPKFPATKLVMEANDPFLTDNPYWRSRSERFTHIERLRSPNTGRLNGIAVKSNETALWMPMSRDQQQNLPAQLHKAQVVEVIKTDKTQDSSSSP